MSKKVYIGVSDKYKVLEYLESTGTQYIDTGFCPNQDTKMEIVAQFQGSTSSTVALAGYRSSASSNFWILWGGSDMENFYARYSSSSNIEVSADFLTKNTFTLNKNQFSVGTKNNSGSSGTFTADGPIYLFGVNYQNSVRYNAKVKIFSCKIYDNGLLVRDLLPCEDENGVAGMFDRVNNTFYKNAGTGTFSKGEVLENLVSDGIAKKVSRMYVGVDGVARRIKKGYIGVGSVARPFTSSEPTYFGFTPNNLVGHKYGLFSASTQDYAFIAGGHYYRDVCETFDKSLTYSEITGLSNKAFYGSGVSFKNKAYFAGGMTEYGSYFYSTVECYDNSKTKTVLSDGLSVARGRLAGATVGDYLLFAGGESSSGSSDIVDFFDESGTRNITTMSMIRTGLSGASLPDYAVFGLGCYRLDVEVFDASLTKISGVQLTENQGKYQGAATSVNGYALFAGGKNSSGQIVSKCVAVIDNSLTSGVTRNLSWAGYDLASTKLGDYALFAGGSGETISIIGNLNPKDNACYFDSSLTMVEMTNLTKARRQHTAVTIGSYALFAGGYEVDANSTHNTVEVYMI